MTFDSTDRLVQTCSLVLIESSRWQIADVDEDTGLTLLAVISEDPSSWSEMAAYWPRYRTPATSEFADAVSWMETDPESILARLRSVDDWLAIDLPQKRLLASSGWGNITAHMTYAMSPSPSCREQWPLSVDLPPWWEWLNDSRPEQIRQSRRSPIDRPQPNRAVLYGAPLIRFLAERIITVAQSPEWALANADASGRKQYGMTVEIHRDWLMTPQKDLAGRCPRELLHGGVSWNERVIHGQQLRLQDGFPLIAAPTDVADFDNAPMGREEICIYFDLCRELIDAGWLWVSDHAVGDPWTGDPDASIAALQNHLVKVQHRWLNEPFDGGSPPRFLIECSRRRVPRAMGVEIIGMDSREAVYCAQECDCPICQMMADGDLPGITYCGIDGHHLELDGEFAFSICETYQEWKAEQDQIAAFEKNQVHWPTLGNRDFETDEFASPWRGMVSDDPILGDPSGTLKLAFLVAETVSELQSLDADPTLAAKLNRRFRRMRRSEANDRTPYAKRLKNTLEQIAAKYPTLTSRAADLESRIDEWIRTTG
jgi:hypothetical protein